MEALDGQELLDIYKDLKKEDKRVAFIISDWDMPKIDGATACDMITKIEIEKNYEKCFKAIITANSVDTV